MQTLTKAWTTVLDACSAALTTLTDAIETTVRETAAIPWWGAAVTAVGIRTKAVHVSVGKTKPRIKAINDDGNYTRTMVSLFTFPSGSDDGYNVGCLFAACCVLARVQGWGKALTALAWQKIGKRYGLLTAANLQAAAPALRQWYVGGSDHHHVAGMRAVIELALSDKADAEAAAAREAAQDKADRAKTKAALKGQPSASKMGALFRGMTRTKASADVMAWMREDLLECRSFLAMGAALITEADAKAKAATEAKAKATAKAQTKTAEAA